MPDPGQVRFLQQVKARCSSASSPGDRRAAVSAGSDPSNGDLWSTPPEFHLTGPPRLYPPLPVSTDGMGKKTQKLDRGCIHQGTGERTALQMPLRELQ